jgi:AraC-like DNA-binding protein
VVYHRRPGGQSQFSALLEMQGGRFDALLAWARENLALPLTVDQLAEQAAMSPRNFARLFTAETGATPAKAVERLRVEAARALLDSQPLQVEDVALETGFGDQERMRRAFLRAFGQPPQALRRAARASQPWSSRSILALVMASSVFSWVLSVSDMGTLLRGCPESTRGASARSDSQAAAASLAGRNGEITAVARSTQASFSPTGAT